MERVEMIRLLIDFYREAGLENPTDVSAWCQAKGLKQWELEEEIARWQKRYGSKD